MYDYANMDFVTFEKDPAFNKTGTDGTTLTRIPSSTR